jgi:hypothetical protein
MTDISYEPPPEWVEKIRAIGIDTNSLNQGNFHKGELENLARQAKEHSEMEIWIAEPVVWEWAEHLHRARLEFNKRLNSLNKAGIEIEAQPSEVDESVEFVRNSIEKMGSNIKIIPVGSVAVEALKDQILVRRPGERKVRNDTVTKPEFIKTGASDSAIYRAYFQQSGEQNDRYVILSGDSDVKSAHESWGYEVQTIKSRWDVEQEIFRMINASEALVASCLNKLRDELPKLNLKSFNTSLRGITDNEVGPFSASGDRILTGFHDARFDRKANVVTATACVMTDMFGPDVVYEPDQSEVHIFTDHQWNYPDAALYVDVLFAIDDQENCTSLTLGLVRSASVDDASRDLSDIDGPLVLLENLGMVPALASFDWAENFFEPQSTSEVVEGDALELSFDPVLGEGWSLTAEYRGHSVAVYGKVRYDTDHFAYGNDSLPVRVRTDSQVIPQHPTLAINALLMNTPRVP